jgi:plasmid stability protein
MATIQIRNVPEDDYEALRAAAKAEGKSLQSYMQEQATVMARRAKKRAAVEAVQEVWERTPGAGLTAGEIVTEVRAMRGE